MLQSGENKCCYTHMKTIIRSIIWVLVTFAGSKSVGIVLFVRVLTTTSCSPSARIEVTSSLEPELTNILGSARNESEALARTSPGSALHSIETPSRFNKYKTVSISKSTDRVSSKRLVKTNVCTVYGHVTGVHRNIETGYTHECNPT